MKRADCLWTGKSLPRDVDSAALQDERNATSPVPDDLHQETDLNVGEGDQAAVGYDVMDGNMELMSENNVLAQGILFESEEVNETFLPWRLQ